MRVLVACEFSQIVTKVFRDRGHEAYSCDILPTEGNPEWHIQGDAIAVAYGGGYDLMIAHPPCTYLTYNANRVWNEPGRCKKRLEALEFFRLLWEAPIEKICIENPRGCASPTIAKYTQLIQPYFFGDCELKATCLWLKNLPPLQHYKTEPLPIFLGTVHVKHPEPVFISPSGKKNYFTEAVTKNRQMTRSRTFPGIANAMAEQWG